MGDVNNFLLNKKIDEYLEYFASVTKKEMRKNEYLVVLLNFMLGSELNMSHTEDQIYFNELCDYYIMNSNLTEIEIEYMRKIVKGEKKEEVKGEEKEEEEGEGFLKVLLRIVKWTEENIEIKG